MGAFAATTGASRSAFSSSSSRSWGIARLARQPRRDAQTPRDPHEAQAFQRDPRSASIDVERNGAAIGRRHSSARIRQS